MRHWRTVSTSLATLAARLCSVFGMLVINGVANRRMTRDQFGLWSILYAINLLSNGLDFGFRFTLGNRLAALGSRGSDAEAERRETFLAIVLQQAVIAGVLMVLIFFIAPLLPWPHWFKVTDPLLAAQVKRLIPISLILMVATLPVALTWTVLFAYQEIKLASFLGGASNILQTGIFVCAACFVKFSWVMLIYFTSTIAIGILLTIYVFIRRKWRFSILPLRSIMAVTRSLSRVSIHAFFNNLSGTISVILGLIVSGASSGLGAAGDYNLVQKLFSFLTTSYLALLAPVSPSVTLEAASGSWDSIRHRLRSCLFIIWPIVFLGGGGLVFAAHPLLIHLWTGRWLEAYPLAALLLLWACLSGFAMTFVVFLNSIGLLKLQAAISMAVVIPSIFLSIYMSRWLGVPGIALAAAISTLPGVLIWPFYTRDSLRQKRHHV